MDSLLTGLSQHGYSILAVLVFIEAVGFPAPAAVALLIAGAASARGTVDAVFALGAALAAMMLGDVLLFFLGRRTGWWLLGVLCRLSLNPESCIMTSADSFHKRGRFLLIFSKFVPGINTMAAPLAGSMNMRVSQFLALDLAGTALYTGSYFLVGFLFSGALSGIMNGYQAFGRIVAAVLGIAVAAYLVYQVWLVVKPSPARDVRRVEPDEVQQAVEKGNSVIYDVRSHGYYDPNATRIRGSQRLEPNAISQVGNTIPVGAHVYLYCTCVREATAARVAMTLQEKGISSSVIHGGLAAWKKSGLPVEQVPAEDVSELPIFN
jgi:membrane protein DedA with SNARE-associated domain/rhodanese-related sulfurtransferase